MTCIDPPGARMPGIAFRQILNRVGPSSKRVIGWWGRARRPSRSAWVRRPRSPARRRPPAMRSAATGASESPHPMAPRAPIAITRRPRRSVLRTRPDRAPVADRLRTRTHGRSVPDPAGAASGKANAHPNLWASAAGPGSRPRPSRRPPAPEPAATREQTRPPRANHKHPLATNGAASSKGSARFPCWPRGQRVVWDVAGHGDAHRGGERRTDPGADAARSRAPSSRSPRRCSRISTGNGNDPAIRGARIASNCPPERVPRTPAPGAAGNSGSQRRTRTSSDPATGQNLRAQFAFSRANRPERLKRPSVDVPVSHSCPAQRDVQQDIGADPMRVQAKRRPSPTARPAATGRRNAPAHDQRRDRHVQPIERSRREKRVTVTHRPPQKIRRRPRARAESESPDVEPLRLATPAAHSLSPGGRTSPFRRA